MLFSAFALLSMAKAGRFKALLYALYGPRFAMIAVNVTLPSLTTQCPTDD